MSIVIHKKNDFQIRYSKHIYRLEKWKSGLGCVHAYKIYRRARPSRGLLLDKCMWLMEYFTFALSIGKGLTVLINEVSIGAEQKQYLLKLAGLSKV